LIVGCARRIVWDDFVYELEVADIIYPDDWQNESNPVFYITQRFMHAQEKMVLPDPAQYLWMHRRWKTRPKSELKAMEAQAAGAVTGADIDAEAGTLTEEPDDDGTV
jgi:hypothetical protein